MLEKSRNKADLFRIVICLLFAFSIYGCDGDSPPDRADGNPVPRITANCVAGGVTFEASSPLPIVFGPPPARCNFRETHDAQFNIREWLWSRSDNSQTSIDRRFSNQEYVTLGDSRVEVIVEDDRERRGSDFIDVMSVTGFEANAIQDLIKSGRPILNQRDVLAALKEIRLHQGFQ